MNKKRDKNIGKLAVFIFIFAVILAWTFNYPPVSFLKNFGGQGWPQIWKNPPAPLNKYLSGSFPPQVQEVKANPDTFFLLNTTSTGSNWTASSTAGAAIDSTTIIQPPANDGISGKVYHFNPGTTNTAAGTTTLPTAIGAGWRSANAINGTMAAGTSTLNFKLTTAGATFVCNGTCNLTAGFRLWKTDVNGAAIGGALTGWATSTSQLNATAAGLTLTASSSVSTSSVTFSSTEYLFVEALLYWAGPNDWDTGGEQAIFNVNEATGETLVTPTITPAGGTTVSCSTNITSTAFGTLSTGAVSTASPNASTTLSCSGTTAGCTLRISDTGLATSSPAYTIASTTGTLAAGTEGWGIQAATTTAGTGGTLTINPIYNVTGNTVGKLGVSTVLASSTVDVTNREVVVTHKAAISAATQAGSYTDTITYSCIAN